MDVPRVGYGVVFITHAYRQIHDDPPVVDVLSNTGKLPLQYDYPVHVSNAALAVCLWRHNIMLELRKTVNIVVFTKVDQRGPSSDTAILVNLGNILDDGEVVFR
jgi:hypothetical protein